MHVSGLTARQKVLLIINVIMYTYLCYVQDSQVARWAGVGMTMNTLCSRDYIFVNVYVYCKVACSVITSFRGHL